ncbi:unnamed protein product [Auanema sp. JU1783]|nr:unnamed protein product [Auanema sp. JU1783]
MRLCYPALARNLRHISHNNQVVGQTVYLTHVKWVTGRNQLENYFSRFGQVKAVNMFFDAETGLHRGFASVTFETKESASRAMALRPHIIDGDRVDVEPYIPLVSKRKDIVL